jgi:glycosidase
MECLEDGCWLRDFQHEEAYNRHGAIQHWSNPDPLDPNAECRRGDFFDLKKLNGYHDPTLQAMIRCFRYWIALSDCDGSRIDAAKHIPKDVCRQFSQAINFYAFCIGKENFLIVGEITDDMVALNYLSLFDSLLDRALTAVLDINGSPLLLAGAAKGTMDPRWFFRCFRLNSDLTRYIQTGRLHVLVMDDDDMSCKSHKERFSAGNTSPHRDWQVDHAVANQLLTPGIPCLYSGTEQAFAGNRGYHDYAIEPRRFGEDRYVREGMFGGSFGAFGTSGCHFFDTNHPTYLRIAAMACLRRQEDPIARTMNTHGLGARGAEVTVDPTINGRDRLRELTRAEWSDERLRASDGEGEWLTINRQPDGRATVRVDLPPAGMVILA